MQGRGRAGGGWIEHGSHRAFTSCAQLGANLIETSREQRGQPQRSTFKVRSFPWVIGALLIVLIAGGIGFFLGVGSNVATVVPAAGAPVVYGWHFFGFPFFGLFFLLFLFVIFAVIRRVAWGGRQPGPGWGGRGYYGHAGWKSEGHPADGRRHAPALAQPSARRDAAAGTKRPEQAVRLR